MCSLYAGVCHQGPLDEDDAPGSRRALGKAAKALASASDLVFEAGPSPRAGGCLLTALRAGMAAPAMSPSAFAGSGFARGVSGGASKALHVGERIVLGRMFAGKSNFAAG